MVHSQNLDTKQTPITSLSDSILSKVTISQVVRKTVLEMNTTTFLPILNQPPLIPCYPIPKASDFDF